MILQFDSSTEAGDFAGRLVAANQGRPLRVVIVSSAYRRSREAASAAGQHLEWTKTNLADRLVLDHRRGMIAAIPVGRVHEQICGLPEDVLILVDRESFPQDLYESIVLGMGGVA